MIVHRVDTTIMLGDLKKQLRNAALIFLILGFIGVTFTFILLRSSTPMRPHRHDPLIEGQFEQPNHQFQWKLLDPLISRASYTNQIKPCSRYGHGSVFHHDAIYITHGYQYWSEEQQPRYLNDTWKYNLKSGEWTRLNPLGSLPLGRSGFTLNIIEDLSNNVEDSIPKKDEILAKGIERGVGEDVNGLESEEKDWMCLFGGEDGNNRKG